MRAASSNRFSTTNLRTSSADGPKSLSHSILHASPFPSEFCGQAAEPRSHNFQRNQYFGSAPRKKSRDISNSTQALHRKALKMPNSCADKRLFVQGPLAPIPEKTILHGSKNRILALWRCAREPSSVWCKGQTYGVISNPELRQGGAVLASGHNRRWDDHSLASVALGSDAGNWLSWCGGRNYGR